MAAPLRIDSLRFNGGSEVDTSAADVVVLVGPNNSGKSRTLQEIVNLASAHPNERFSSQQLFVLDGFAPRKTDAESLSQWLKANRLPFVAPNTQEPSVRAVGAGDFALSEIRFFWSHAVDTAMGSLAGQLIRFIGPGDGRGMIGSPGRLGMREIPEHAVQTLVRNPALRRSFESAFRGAFHQNLIIDSWFSNTTIRLSPMHVQADFAHTSEDGRASPELEDRLSQLPLLETQSDGIRAFAGLLLTLVTVRYPVQLLDEPETFLHPPQARLLGEYIGLLRGDGQIFIATHSLDILLGLLRQTAARVLVVRLSRRDGKTSAATVIPDTVRALWRDPLLRFSRALDGLFHEGVVICEGDTDSQFYSAIAYHLATEHQRQASEGSSHLPGDREANAADDAETLPEFSTNPFDVMFTYAGGKHRIHMIAEALTDVHVPVRCIVDFDMLNSEANLKRLVESLGHEYSPDLEKLRLAVDAGLRGNAAAATIGSVRAAILKALDKPDDSPVESSTASAIVETLEPPKGWSAAKRKGKIEVPPGPATVAVEQLIAELKVLGVFVVPSGAVESWVKTASHKSTAWVVEVIERDLISSATDAQAFVTEVLQSLSVT